jgi:mono/diheme cytochrome c family protein
MLKKLGLVTASFLFVACSKDATVMQFMPHMATTPNLKPQSGYSASADGAAMLMPPDGTLPRNFNRYHFTDAEEAAKALTNPLAVNEANLRRGQKVYNNSCYVCHGAEGLGDGPVVPPFPIPKSLLSDNMRNWKDGHLFHVITKGQGIMPSYAQQVPVNDRWAVIHYIRVLQRASNPTAADVEAFKKVKVK